MSTTPPPIGSMYLYDDVTPPLVDGSYRLDVVTNVTYGGQQAPLTNNSGYFNIEGPRFTLPATDVAAVYPPNNGHGGFDENIPQIVIARRTLPWERRLTSDPSLIGTPTRDQWTPQPNPFPPVPGTPQEYGPAPWLALLLFQEGEYTLHQNVPLKSVVPADVYARLEVPDGIICDSVEVEAESARVDPSQPRRTDPARPRPTGQRRRQGAERVLRRRLLRGGDGQPGPRARRQVSRLPGFIGGTRRPGPSRSTRGGGAAFLHRCARKTRFSPQRPTPAERPAPPPGRAAQPPALPSEPW